MKRIGVYLASSPGHRPVFAAAARDLGKALARRGLGLVYGGGNVGLMDVVANAVLEEGGEVIGVIPTILHDMQVYHSNLTELRLVKDMHERKAMMADLADGFIALPGGFGTLDELAEILTWIQLGIQRKPAAVLNVEGYFDALIRYLDRAVDEGFLKPPHRALLLEGGEPDELLDRMAAWEPSSAIKVKAPERRAREA